MAIRRIKVGTDITTGEKIQYDGDDVPAGVKETLSGWEADRIRGGGDYGGVTIAMEEHLAKILSKAGDGPFERDNVEDFARRIMDMHNLAKKRIEAGDADTAARFAYKAGFLHAQAHMKFMWRPEVIIAQKAAAAREKAHDEAFAENKSIHDEYERIRVDNLKKHKGLIHQEIGDRRKMTADAVRQRIKRYKDRLRAKDAAK
jgi:hypothetical protein